MIAYHQILEEMCRLHSVYEKVWQTFTRDAVLGDSLDCAWTAVYECTSIFAERCVAGVCTEFGDMARLVEVVDSKGDEMANAMVFTGFLEGLVHRLDSESEDSRNVLGKFGPEAIKFINEYNALQGVADRY